MYPGRTQALQWDSPLPPYTPEMDAALAKEIEARSEQAKAEADTKAKKGPAKAAKPETSETAATPDTVKASEGAGQVSSPADGATDTGEHPPVTPDALDLSFLPEEVRSKVHFDDDKAYAAVKSGWLAHSEATRKFQEASVLRKEADADKRDAENYRALVADPDVAQVVVKAVADKRDGKKPSPPAPSVLDAPIDPENPVASIDAKLKALADKQRELDQREAKAREAANVRVAVGDAVLAYATQSGEDPAVVEQAVKDCDAALAKNGQKWTPETVAVLLPPYVEMAKAKRASAPKPFAPTNGAVTKTAPASATPGTETVASPTGRGGVHQTQPVPYPSWYVNGQPPKGYKPGEADLEQEHLYLMRRRFGPNVTLEDIRSVSR